MKEKKSGNERKNYTRVIPILDKLNQFYLAHGKGNILISKKKCTYKVHDIISYYNKHKVKAREGNAYELALFVFFNINNVC